MLLFFLLLCDTGPGARAGGTGRPGAGADFLLLLGYNPLLYNMQYCPQHFVLQEEQEQEQEEQNVLEPVPLLGYKPLDGDEEAAPAGVTSCYWGNM